jgi:hypothetical protein
MASQVAHIIYSQKYFSKYPSSINKDEFMLGCIFPDIRRVDETIKRKYTHLKFDPLDLDFSGLTAFEAGWKFHLYCDMRREEILNHYKFYNLENTTDIWHLPAKILEDEILYGYYDNWEKLVSYFNNSPFIKTDLHVSQETMSHWYATVARYFEKNPNDKTMQAFLSKQVTLNTIANDILKVVDKLRKDARVVDVLKKVAEEIV